MDTCNQETPCCPHCGQPTKKWKVPDTSTWTDEFQYVCFNDECAYFVKGWDWMMSQHQVRASYRCRIDPRSGKAHPLPVWSHDALKDDILDLRAAPVAIVRDSKQLKRSAINRLQKSALEFFHSHHLSLPAWATWRPDDWKRAGDSAVEIKKRKLGWDITDFGKGEFDKEGLVLFTLRNGPAHGSGEPYCEKLMISRIGQTMPAHFHWSKTEDIINRAGGTMVMRLWNSDKSGNATDERVRARIDGIWREVAAGEELPLAPGESITLTPGLYHSLFAKGSDILIGEVSTVNDDEKDNKFLIPINRFSSIEEDAEILYYLCNEYP